MKTAQITVEYLNHLGTDLTVVNAARTSFGKESWWADVEKMVLKDGDAGLIRYLATGYRTKEWDEFLDEIMGYALRYDRDAAKVLLTNALHAYKRRAQHWAPFAHPHMQIRMQLPIFLARQFVKHQVGGVWSEESRRYISDEPEVWFPEEWHTRPDDIKQGSGGLIEHQDEARGYAEDVVSLALEKYFLLQDLGVAPEEARTILPLNMMTTVTWTGSLLFWSRVCNQRVDSHAQKAAQELGKKISDIAQPLFPTSWAALVG
jgi:thymidylate synthase (FAD)